MRSRITGWHRHLVMYMQQQQQHSTLSINTDAVITVPMFQIERTALTLTVLKVSDSASTHTCRFGVDGSIDMRMEQCMACVKLSDTNGNFTVNA